MRAALAFVLNLNVALYFAAGQQFYQSGSLPSQRRQLTSGVGGLFRTRRDADKRLGMLSHHVVDSKTECMMISSEEGYFHYKSPGESQACGIYLVAEPAKKIEVVFTYFDVPCEDGGLVAWIDGWELKGKFFPPPNDHPLPEDERFAEFCGTKKIKRILVSSQNAVLMQYLIPNKGKGFSIAVRHIRNPKPCNILWIDSEDTFTIRNYGRAVNCSLSAIYPSTVRLIALSVGVATSSRISRELETGTIHRCEKRGLSDYVEIGGATDLDSGDLQKIDNVCGLDSTAAKYRSKINCEVVTIKLVSSGEFDNSVTVGVQNLGTDEEATFNCV